MAAPRFPLADLITEYLLHGERKHLYVEGQEDRAVLHWFLGCSLGDNTGLFSIDEVEITPEKLNENGLSNGQRNRLLVLARELDKALPENNNPVLCIVDADFDYVLGRVENNRFLAYTDGTSLDMYAFTESALERVVRLGLRESYAEPGKIIEALFVVLKDIFLTRATNESLEMGLEWLPFSRRCKIQSDGTILFDGNRFVREYLGKNGALDKLDYFTCRKKELAKKDVHPENRLIRGHDFGELLTRYLRSVIKTRVVKKSG